MILDKFFYSNQIIWIFKLLKKTYNLIICQKELSYTNYNHSILKRNPNKIISKINNNSILYNLKINKFNLNQKYRHNNKFN